MASIRSSFSTTTGGRETSARWTTPPHRAVGRNPLCGDHLQLALRLSADGQIDDIRFTGEGCAISRASASLMTAALKRQGRAEAERLFAAMHAMMTGADGCLVSARAGTRAGAKPEETEPRLAKLAALGGVRAFPARVKCATLAWHTLMAALDGGGRAAQTEV